MPLAMPHEKPVARAAVLMKIQIWTPMMMTHRWKNFSRKKWKDQKLHPSLSKENFHVSELPVQHAKQASQNMQEVIQEIQQTASIRLALPASTGDTWTIKITLA